jgi:hypothetical protein
VSLADDAIGNLHIKRDAAFEFFVVYARYEYAAKAARYVYKPPIRGNKLPELKINIQEVADKIKAKFQLAIQSNRSLSDAVAYYQNFPPKGQVWNGIEPDWADIEYNDTFPCILLRRLAQARNNLFHGGKGWKGDEQAWGRDNLLISHGLTILEAVIKSDDALGADFTSYQ